MTSIFINTIVITSVLWGLMWDRSDLFNFLYKFMHFVLAIAGVYALLHPQVNIWMIPVFGLYSLFTAILWKSNNVLNIVIKLVYVWLTLTACGLVFGIIH